LISIDHQQKRLSTTFDSAKSQRIFIQVVLVNAVQGTSATLLIEDSSKKAVLSETISILKGYSWKIHRSQMDLNPGNYKISISTYNSLFYIREIKITTNEGLKVGIDPKNFCLFYHLTRILRDFANLSIQGETLGQSGSSNVQH